MTIIPVVSIGTRRTAAFVDYTDGTGEFKPDLVLPVYPASPHGDALRAARVNAGVSLRIAAKRLGIRVVDLCNLEHGRAVLSDEDAWNKAIKTDVTP